MLKFGDYNEMTVKRAAAFGIFLDAQTGNTSEDLLIPNASIVGEKPKVGDKVRVFIYRDSKDRLIATMKEPAVTVNNLAYLKVSSISDFGAFMDFGLERDILVPIKEQKYPMMRESYYLVFVYEDKTGRLAASTEVDRYLENAPEDTYKLGDVVKGIVYGMQTNDSLMVAIDNKYRGVVLKNEYFTRILPGEVIEGKVKKLYEDGRIGFTPRKKMVEEKEDLSSKILEYMKRHNGFMPYNDKSTPEEIKEKFNTSKNYFKIALGNLMKKGLVIQDGKGTRLKEDK